MAGGNVLVAKAAVQRWPKAAEQVVVLDKHRSSIEATRKRLLHHEQWLLGRHQARILLGELPAQLFETHGLAPAAVVVHVGRLASPSPVALRLGKISVEQHVTVMMQGKRVASGAAFASEQRGEAAREATGRGSLVRCPHDLTCQ